MTWVRRAEPPAPPSHQCYLPNPNDAEVGDLFRCDTCRELWRVAVFREEGWTTGIIRQWRPARWWQRLRHRDRDDQREDGSMMSSITRSIFIAVTPCWAVGIAFLVAAVNGVDNALIPATGILLPTFLFTVQGLWFWRQDRKEEC